MINSVLKAIRVMRLFSATKPRLTLSEVSDELSIPKSTAHNLLNTLASEGCIEKIGRDQYALGTALLPLTQAIRVNVEIRDPAAPLLRQLADTSKDSAYLTVRDGDYALYIYAVESPQRLMARTAIGDRVHMHCTAVGKSILAYMEADEIAATIERVGLPSFTEATITDSIALAQNLKDIRQQGFAIDQGEHEDGVFCIGAPIFNSSGTVLGACSTSGLDPEITTERRAELAKLVVDTAQRISRHMGYVPRRMSAVNELSYR